MNPTKRNASYLAVLLGMASFIIIIALAAKPVNSMSGAATNMNTNETSGTDEFPYEIGKSCTFKNLQLFFLATDKNMIDKEYITLSEAMNHKYVTVIETSNVNQLAVENHSSHFVFISAGDIVKGGRQDRTIGKDIILPPKSGKVPLASFCVESGRWQQRGAETSDEFSTSNNSLSSRELKLAAKKNENQGEVWNQVNRQQEKVNESMVANYEYDSSFDVRDENSETSLQLTLENKDLQKIKAEYEAFFKKLGFDTNKTVGFVYAINGEIYGIDIYNNYKLFNDLWPKLLDAVIVEAISDNTQEDFKPIDATAILSLVKSFDSAKAETEKEEINSETTFSITTTPDAVKFETFDKREDNRLLHLNYITVDTTSTANHSQYNENYYLQEDNRQIQQNRGWE